jgi:hypothetical protein
MPPYRFYRRFILCGDHSTHFARIPQLVEQCRAVAPTLKIDGPVLGGVLYNLAWFLKMSAFEKAVRLKFYYANLAPLLNLNVCGRGVPVHPVGKSFQRVTRWLGFTVAGD